MSCKDFDWSELEDEFVVRPQARTAVYFNAHDEIVLRQEANLFPGDDDAVVFLSRDTARQIAEAILRLLSLETS